TQESDLVTKSGQPATLDIRWASVCRTRNDFKIKLRIRVTWLSLTTARMQHSRLTANGSGLGMSTESGNSWTPKGINWIYMRLAQCLRVRGLSGRQMDLILLSSLCWRATPWETAVVQLSRAKHL